MKTVNLLHTADLHLRDSQYGRMERGKDFTKALFQLVEIAHAQDCKCILAAGDILHTKRPSSKNISDMMEMNRRLLDKNIRMLCITGNHDECSPNWLSVIEEEAIKQSGKSAIEDITNKTTYVNTSVGTRISIYGAPYPDMHADDFIEQAPSWPKADILMYHGGIKEFSFYPMGDKALSINDLPSDKYQMIALGDIHTSQYRYRDGCLIGYPGPIEFCSANESPEKSCTIIRFEEKEGKLLKLSEAVDIVPIHTRRVIQRDIKSENEMPALLEEIRKHKGENPIIRVLYHPVVNDVFTRIAAIVDPCESIVRVEPRGSITPTKVSTKATDVNNRLKPTDFVSEYFKGEEDLYKVAMTCCDSETRPGAVLDEYIEKKLQSYYQEDEKF